MTQVSSGSGGDFLTKKSEVVKVRQQLPKLQRVLIIDDEAFDTDRLAATLRVIFGYDLEIDRAATLSQSLEIVMKASPDLIFLDDILKPSDTAAESIPLIRRANYTGPIVVVSGQVTHKRSFQLKDCGAVDVIHKDDVDSVRLGEALIRVFGGAAKT